MVLTAVDEELRQSEHAAYREDARRAVRRLSGNVAREALWWIAQRDPTLVLTALRGQVSGLDVAIHELGTRVAEPPEGE